MEIIAESEYRFVIPRQDRMLVPGVVFASRALIPDPAGDRALEQEAGSWTILFGQGSQSAMRVAGSSLCWTGRRWVAAGTGL